jgi:pyrimidine-nucleoside phosphorylase
MRVPELIARKRDGGSLTAEEIEFVVRGYTSGEIPDYQVSALLMAIVFRGMSEDEILALTTCMLESGAVLDLSDLGIPVADKHSTGGVGDKTSLLIAPIVACAGVLVPMISGRALGHSGGTLDKLESIPGFCTDVKLDRLRDLLVRNGVGLIGQTTEIAPADRRLYALRDATACVPSIPLIVASIMSKKLAEGLDALVLDVKAGSGAFMKTEADAHRLASILCSIGTRHGTKVQALVTSMNEPLGKAVGNALEVVECIDAMKGEGPADMVDLSIELAARMIVLAKGERGTSLEGELNDARLLARRILDSGEALERFARIVEDQGGDPRVLDDTSRLDRAPVERDVVAWRDGYLTAIDCEALGHTIAALGAGRSGVSGSIDVGVGLVAEARIGDEVRTGDVLCRVVARTEASADIAVHRIKTTYEIGEERPERMPLILDVVDPEGAQEVGGA